MSKIEELQSKRHELELIIDEIDNDWDYSRPYSEYCEVCEPTWRELANIRREITLISEYELEDHDNIGNLYTLKDFKGNVDCGGFIDYDGHGYYATKDKQSSLVIKPSDIKAKKYRKDFTHVKWYNR